MTSLSAKKVVDKAIVLTITIFQSVTITVEKIAATVVIINTPTAATTTFVEEIEVFDRITAYIQMRINFHRNIYWFH